VVSLLGFILVTLWIATVAQTAFVVIYSTRTPWRHNFVGRALFLKSVVVWLALVNSLVNVHLPHEYRLQAAAVLMVLLALAIVYQCAALIDRMWLDKRGVHEHG
jgi:hypothetical protein